MGMVKWVVAGLVLAWLAYYVPKKFEEPPFPPMDPNPWWGPGKPKAEEDISVNSFKINIPEEDLVDLKARLALPLRLTPGLEGANFTYGMNAQTLEKIVHHWRHSYDWRQREAKLNTYPHFKTRIEGLDIHFMRAKAQVGNNAKVKVVPLLLVHGWPGSFVEFYGILPFLTTPQEGSDVVFDVICPSIPGYGFSQGSSKQGLGVLETSQIFLKLMKRLGFDKFYLQGGDWGSLIVSSMATLYPENILGVHMNMIVANTPGTNFKLMLGSILPSCLVVAEEDQDKIYPLGEFVTRLARETGYMHIQATKPDTIGAALNQSPVSLAAYILEKFSTWTHKENPWLPDGGLLQKDFPINLDDMLDNICIYWFTGSITTSVRFYAENFNKRTLGSRNLENNPTRVPSGLASFPQEIANSPRNFAAHKHYDMVSYRDLPVGGHFAAMERPHILAVDFHQFVNSVEKRT